MVICGSYGNGGDPGEANHLLRARGQGIGVGQARAQADGAAGHTAFEVVLHAQALAGRGDTGQVADVADPERRVTGQGRELAIDIVAGDREALAVDTDADAAAIVDGVFEAVASFTGGLPLQDDITLVALKRK